MLWSELRFKGKPLPSPSTDRKVTIVTPLGTFVALTEGYWEETTPGMTGFCSAVDTDPHNISAEELSQGFYRTSGRDYGPSGPWTDIQLSGTPQHWVYIFVETELGYQGFWVEPEKTDDIPWE